VNGLGTRRPLRDLPRGAFRCHEGRVRLPTVSELVEDARHGGRVAGASRVGVAAADGRIVRVGLWRAPSGAVVRARFTATTCASLVAYAEAACRLVEANALAGARDLAALLRASVAGVHPRHLDRADLVAAALARALVPEGDPP
jgi:NifU-like protein involved in Fe-S cluster formation